MNITIRDYAQALFLALQEAREEDHDRIIDNLVQELKLSDRLHEFEQIVAEFEKLLELDGGTRQVEITLNKVAAVNEKLIEELNQQFGSQVTVKQDDTIIGGAVIRMDDTLVNGSVRGKLEKMKKELSLS